MANLKNITDVPMAESAEGLNLIVNDNGAAKQIPASAVGAQADFAVTDESHPAFIKNKPVQVQPDWNQNDSTAPDYVKNRPFWADDIVETVLFDGTVENDADINIELIIGQEYIVTLDGVEYVLTALDDDGVYIGSRSLWWEEDYVDSEPPFAYGDGWFYTVNDGDTHTFTVIGDSSKIHMIDEKFIPLSYLKMWNITTNEYESSVKILDESDTHERTWSVYKGVDGSLCVTAPAGLDYSPRQECVYMLRDISLPDEVGMSTQSSKYLQYGSGHVIGMLRLRNDIDISSLVVTINVELNGVSIYVPASITYENDLYAITALYVDNANRMYKIEIRETNVTNHVFVECVTRLL